MNEIQIPLSSPDITNLEIQAVVDVLKTRHLSLGPKGPEFERAFCRYLNVEHAVAVSSGTAGLHACLLALNIGEGDEVITTPFSFIASSNVILMAGAKPVFADIDPQSLNLDVAKAEKLITPKTKAILGVEAFGNPAGMRETASLAARHEIPLIEDSCEALGSSYKKTKCGTFGRCGVFGFYPNKQITTGEGGMIVTNDEKLADMCRSLRNQGRDPGGSWLAHARLGYNYRLSDINCALGIVQMQRLPDILARRQRVAHSYVNHLLDSKHIILPTIETDTTMSWFVFVVRLTDNFTAADRDAIIQYMRARGVGCSNYFPPIHLQPFYANQFGYKRGDFPITEYVSDRTLALPFHNSLTELEIESVVYHLNRAIATRTP
jgi:perosamine synthetase